MDHAATMRRAYDLISAGDVDGFGDLLADDFVEHEELPGLEPGKEGVKAFFRIYRAAFPDLRMDVNDVLIDGQRAAVLATFTGTDSGGFMGMPPTGRRVTIPVAFLYEFKDGKITRDRRMYDFTGLLIQIGTLKAKPA